MNDRLLELIADGLSFPTSLAFDDEASLYVAESGLPFGGSPPGGRVLRRRAQDWDVVADGLRSPVNGLVWADGVFYLSEGGAPSRLSRLGRDG